MKENSALPKTTKTVDSTLISPLKKWGALFVLSLALAIIIIDTTLLNVSLRSIILDLHTDIQKIQWVITAYSLMLAAFTITGGRLGDLFGRKKMFILGAVIFAIGSFIASISTQVWMMIMGEAIIEGIGAALMMPATSSILVSTFKGRERAIAFGVWGGIAGAAAAIGPVLGGWLTSAYSWRWGFRINVVVVILLIIGSMVIKESRDKEEKPALDVVGVLLSALGLFFVVFGFIESSTYGWWKAKEVFSIWSLKLDFGSISIIPFSIALGLIILLLFVFWQNHLERLGKTPLVSLKLFKNRQFVSGMATTSVMSLGQAGLIFSVPIFLQAVRGLDAFHTGLAMLPMSISLLVVAPFASVLGKYVPPKRLIQIGLLIDIGAFLLLRNAASISATQTDFAIGFAAFGIGMGIIMSQVNNLTLSAVSVQEAGEASGVNNTMRQVGSSLGSAIMGAILISVLSTQLTSGILNSSVIPQPLKQPLADTIATQTSAVEFGGGAQLDKNIPPTVGQEIQLISQQATVDGVQTTLAYGAVFIFLGFLVSFLLPNKKQTHLE